jgi:hypothetical protein
MSRGRISLVITMCELLVQSHDEVIVFDLILSYSESGRT